MCFRTTTDTYMDMVVGYIDKYINDVLPRITVQIFPNQKAWINREVCAKLKAWTELLAVLTDLKNLNHLLPPDSLEPL